MTTLSLDQLRADLGRITAHGLTTTNVVAVQHTANGNVFVDVDTSEIEQRIAHAEAERDTDALQYRQEINKLQSEVARLKAALHGVADKAREALAAP